MKHHHGLPRIYFYGGSFNPPGVHHVKIVTRLQEQLKANDLLWIMPCGDRPDKPSTSVISKGHRMRMSQLAFGAVRNAHTILQLSDLFSEQFTPNTDVQKQLWRLFPRYEIVHVVGADAFVEQNGIAEFSAWKSSRKLLEESLFLIITREGFDLDHAILPAHHEFLNGMDLTGSSSEIRQRVHDGQPITGLVPGAVEEHIKFHQLYSPHSMRDEHA